jgi:hypothetical protein
MDDHLVQITMPLNKWKLLESISDSLIARKGMIKYFEKTGIPKQDLMLVLPVNEMHYNALVDFVQCLNSPLLQ